MPMPKSDAGLADARSFMNKAIESQKGWRMFFLTEKEAWAYRQRCYAVRTRELKVNAKIYAEDDIMHTQTVYHQLTFDISEVSRKDSSGMMTKVWALSGLHGDEAYQEIGLGNEEIK